MFQSFSLYPPSKREHGQGLVEFALIVLFLVVLMVGVWEMGSLIWRNVNLGYAASDGVIEAAQRGGNPPLGVPCAGEGAGVAAARAALGRLTDPAVAAAATIEVLDQSGRAIVPCATAGPGQRAWTTVQYDEEIRVSVAYPHTVRAIIFNATVPLRQERVARVQRQPDVSSALPPWSLSLNLLPLGASLRRRRGPREEGQALVIFAVGFAFLAAVLIILAIQLVWVVGMVGSVEEGVWVAAQSGTSMIGNGDCNTQGCLGATRSLGSAPQVSSRVRQTLATNLAAYDRFYPAGVTGSRLAADAKVFVCQENDPSTDCARDRNPHVVIAVDVPITFLWGTGAFWKRYEVTASASATRTGEAAAPVAPPPPPPSFPTLVAPTPVLP